MLVCKAVDGVDRLLVLVDLQHADGATFHQNILVEEQSRAVIRRGGEIIGPCSPSEHGGNARYGHHGWEGCGCW